MAHSLSFGNLRRCLAPMVRPVLEHCAPIRYIAVRLLSFKQSGTMHRCGMDFILPSGDFGVTFETESTGDYEPVTTALLKSLLDEGMTFVDIGAHVGLFSLPASQWVGDSGKVVSFEPHPENFDMLVENVQKNGMQKNMDCVQSAVSDVSTSVHLHMSTFNTGDHQLFHRGNRKTIEVDCTTLDDYFPKGSAIDVVKMDVQGAEAAAFSGMQRVLSDNHDIQVIWELSPTQLQEAGTSAKELLLWLAELGFACTIVDDASGGIVKATVEEILVACPKDSYINILSRRNG